MALRCESLWSPFVYKNKLYCERSGRHDSKSFIITKVYKVHFSRDHFPRWCWHLHFFAFTLKVFVSVLLFNNLNCVWMNQESIPHQVTNNHWRKWREWDSVALKTSCRIFWILNTLGTRFVLWGYSMGNFQDRINKFRIHLKEKQTTLTNENVTRLWKN